MHIAADWNRTLHVLSEAVPPFAKHRIEIQSLRKLEGPSESVNFVLIPFLVRLWEFQATWFDICTLKPTQKENRICVGFAQRPWSNQVHELAEKIIWSDIDDIVSAISNRTAYNSTHHIIRQTIRNTRQDMLDIQLPLGDWDQVYHEAMTNEEEIADSTNDSTEKIPPIRHINETIYKWLISDRLKRDKNLAAATETWQLINEKIKENVEEGESIEHKDIERHLAPVHMAVLEMLLKGPASTDQLHKPLQFPAQLRDTSDTQDVLAYLRDRNVGCLQHMKTRPPRDQPRSCHGCKEMIMQHSVEHLRHRSEMSKRMLNSQLCTETCAETIIKKLLMHLTPYMCT